MSALDRNDAMQLVGQAALHLGAAERAAAQHNDDLENVELLRSIAYSGLATAAVAVMGRYTEVTFDYASHIDLEYRAPEDPR